MNDEELAAVIRRQYAAVIQMLRNAVLACSDDLWDRRAEEAPFWQQAMHAVVTTHLYLLDSPDGPGMTALRASVERDLGIEAADSSQSDVDRVQQANRALTDRTHHAAATPSQQTMLTYIDRLSELCREILARPEMLGAPTVMARAGPTLADRLVYNIRHAQHHVGRLHSILGRHGVSVPWVTGAEHQTV